MRRKNYLYVSSPFENVLAAEGGLGGATIRLLKIFNFTTGGLGFWRKLRWVFKKRHFKNFRFWRAI